MASTYSTNFGIEKIGSGEQSGTWGTTTNHNLDIGAWIVTGKLLCFPKYLFYLNQKLNQY